MKINIDKQRIMEYGTSNNVKKKTSAITFNNLINWNKRFLIDQTRKKIKKLNQIGKVSSVSLY